MTEQIQRTDTSITEDHRDLGFALEAFYLESGDVGQAEAVRDSIDRMDELVARLQSKFAEASR